MDEPKEGATTLKKKAQEKLAAKANPVEETVVATPAAEEAVVEAPVEVIETVETVVETPEAVAETPAADAPAADVAAE
jgi:small subunit ribosomal protein S16